jgi:hypothetical protein
MLTLETLQIFVSDLRSAADPRQVQKALRTGFLFLLPGRHRWNPVTEVHGNVVEGHGRKARGTGATSQHIYGAIWRFTAPILLPL